VPTAAVAAIHSCLPSWRNRAGAPSTRTASISSSTASIASSATVGATTATVSVAVPAMRCAAGSSVTARR
jgi:hypothetical protein